MRRSKAGTMMPAAVPEAAWSASAIPRAGLVGARRPSLPGGRVLVGGLLVGAAGVVFFAATLASAGHHGRAYVVATQALPAGTILGPADLATETMTLPDGASSQAFSGTSGLVGRTVTVPVEAGQLIESTILATTGSTPALRPVSVPVDSDSLAGLKPGVPVDALVGSSPGAASASTSTPSTVTIVVRGATLLSVMPSQLGSAASGTTTVVTLGVADLSEAESLVQAAHSGSIVLIEAEPSDGVGPGSPASS